jgi:aryl-alcohol dehydrogenase-like predicted oxidoreductase
VETRKIGSLDVSVIGLGTNNFGGRMDEGGTKLVLDAAIDEGINHIDTADVYGGTKSEEFIGRILKGRRDQVVLATKFGMATVGGQMKTFGAKPEYARSALAESLRRLDTDYIDLYIVHRFDPETPLADTLAVLAEFVESGKVREIGCSNFTAEQLVEAEAAVREGAPRFVNLQNQYSLIQRDPENGVLQECVRQGIGFVPYSPLAGGLLTGKFRQGAPVPEGTRIAAMPEERRAQTLSEHNLAVVERLSTFAEERSHTILELAISWLLAQPAVVSVISGATTPAQVAANAVAGEWKLTTADLAEIDRLVTEA